MGESHWWFCTSVTVAMVVFGLSAVFVIWQYWLLMAVFGPYGSICPMAVFAAPVLHYLRVSLSDAGGRHCLTRAARVH